MPRWKTIDFLCKICHYRESHVEDKDNPETHLCPTCGEPMEQTIGAPMVMEKSWPDGRKREDAYYVEKMARKMEAASYDLPPEKRAEANKEANKLRKDIKK